MLTRQDLVHIVTHPSDECYVLPAVLVQDTNAPFSLEERIHHALQVGDLLVQKQLNDVAYHSKYQHYDLDLLGHSDKIIGKSVLETILGSIT
jgi:hypothetical protein